MDITYRGYTIVRVDDSDEVAIWTHYSNRDLCEQVSTEQNYDVAKQVIDTWLDAK
jgi:hypothetical protein